MEWEESHHLLVCIIEPLIVTVIVPVILLLTILLLLVTILLLTIGIANFQNSILLQIRNEGFLEHVPNQIPKISISIAVEMEMEMTKVLIWIVVYIQIGIHRQYLKKEWFGSTNDLFFKYSKLE